MVNPTYTPSFETVATQCKECRGLFLCKKHMEELKASSPMLRAMIQANSLESRHERELERLQGLEDLYKLLRQRELENLSALERDIEDVRKNLRDLELHLKLKLTLTLERPVFKYQWSKNKPGKTLEEDSKDDT